MRAPQKVLSLALFKSCSGTRILLLSIKEVDLSLEPGYEAPMGSPEGLRALGSCEGPRAGSWRADMVRGRPIILGCAVGSLQGASSWSSCL